MPFINMPSRLSPCSLLPASAQLQMSLRLEVPSCCFFTAKLLGIGVECVVGGSGRSSSFTDLVVRRTGQPTSPSQLSLLILGAGEVKGIGQLSLQPGETLEVVLHDPTRIDSFLLALQQATACHPCFFVECEISPDMLMCAWKVLLRLQPLKCSVALTTHNTCLY